MVDKKLPMVMNGNISTKRTRVRFRAPGPLCEKNNFKKTIDK